MNIIATATALVGGTIRETVPIWSAIYAWHPVLLVGLIPVALNPFLINAMIDSRLRSDQ